MNIFLVDDNSLIKNALKLFLEEQLNHTVSREFSDGVSFLELNYPDCDIVLMDINMPAKSGIETTREAIRKYPKLKIIAISQYKNSVDLHALICAGFKGFVSKVNLYEDLKKALIAVKNGGYYFPEEIAVSANKL